MEPKTQGSHTNTILSRINEIIKGKHKNKT